MITFGEIACRLVLAGTLFSSSNAFARSASCLDYEPTVVKLTGVITRHMDYGPPNYGEDPAHDTHEVYWRLDLPKPICVNDRSIYDEAESNVRRLELVYSGSYPTGNWVGTRAAITGTLYERFDAHHHTRVLISVVSQVKAEPIRRCRPSRRPSIPRAAPALAPPTWRGPRRLAPL